MCATSLVSILLVFCLLLGVDGGASGWHSGNGHGVGKEGAVDQSCLGRLRLRVWPFSLSLCRVLFYADFSFLQACVRLSLPMITSEFGCLGAGER